MDPGARPNVLFALGNDWGRFASAYAKYDSSAAPTAGLNKLVSTPNFDRIAAEGAIFLNARCSAPGCNPTRSAIFSGLHFWETGLGAIEQGTEWDASIPTFPQALKKAGYRTGYSYEGDQGKLRDYLAESEAYHQAGREFGDFSMVVSRDRYNENSDLDRAKQVLFDEVRGNFCAFLDDQQKDGTGSDGKSTKPWFYCWGPTVTHRDFEPGSGKDIWNLDPDELQGNMPHWLPDVPEVRQDMTGGLYAFENPYESSRAVENRAAALPIEQTFGF
jgi:uncharacterized sulfatase